MEILGFTFDYWVIVGFVGQGFFFMRFFLQWIHSERVGESVIPVYFWYLSIAGALIVLVYALERRDPVFFLGQGFAIVFYVRNLVLIRRKRLKAEVPQTGNNET